MTANRHLIDIQSLDDEAVGWLLSRAATIRSYPGPGLSGNRVANVFCEPSTRTRISFQVAAENLGMSVVTMDSDTTSLTKGESLLDMAQTLQAMGVNFLVLRHPNGGAASELVAGMTGPMHIINAGNGMCGHPSQALLDALTLKQAGLEWRRSTVAIIGDIEHSRVARSNIELLSRLDVNDLRLAGPEGMLPDPPPAGVTLCASLEEAVEDADAIMMLRVQRERIDRDHWPNDRDYHEKWGLKPHHLEKAAPDCRVLHPGPVNRNVEIAPEVADGPHSLILEQVHNGIAMRMALFEWLSKSLVKEVFQ